MCRKLSSPLIALCLVVAASFGALPALAEEPAREQTVVAPSTQEQPTAVAASCQRCGDGYCARSCENERTCPADCAPQTKAAAAARCGKCGDGQCVPQCGETAESCPRDCGTPSASKTAQPARCEPEKE